LDVLRNILNSCIHLESIKICCGKGFLREKDVLETIAKYSPTNFSELKLFNNTRSKLSPKDLESFFTIWKNRTTKKSLNLIIIKEDFPSLDSNKNNMKIIEKYKNSGIIKKFQIIDFTDEVKDVEYLWN